MSNDYIGIYYITTSLIPQLAVAITLPIILIGIGLRFMRNPDKY